MWCLLVATILEKTTIEDEKEMHYISTRTLYRFTPVSLKIRPGAYLRILILTQTFKIQQREAKSRPRSNKY